ncbi:AraC family transcriptional regulator [Spirosoma sp. KNUC1025]|uniref:helix-turn-helix domain-containing protein n=1 Tax=Spirosoma sp. KNUC1025 TaxID=2894082 RepID=UPI003869B850|nr:helix-turn-helix domain-containing protein [Spirosoma sp. KNUC1025]
MNYNTEFVRDPAETLLAKPFPLGHTIPNEEGIFVADLKDSFTELPHRSVFFRPNHYTFLLCRSGRAEFVSNDTSLAIEPGTVLICKPGQYRSWVWYEIKSAYMIAFTETFLKTSIQTDVFTQFPFLVSEPMHPSIFPSALVADFGKTCQEMKKEFATKTACRTQILGSLLMIMLLKVKDALRNEPHPVYGRDKGSLIVHTFKKNLDKHVHDLVAGRTDLQLRVSDFAAMQHLHENYLNAVIKAKTGKTAKTSIAEKIICEAQGLLLHTSLSNKEISYRLGFVESSHFSAYFKKYTGRTPLDYRLSHP